MIAFCFLTYNDITPSEIWNDFFEEIDPSRYSVFIHSKEKINKSRYSFEVNEVQHKVETIKKTDISIVKATIQLLKESRQSKASHYIFLSQNCMPLYSFDELEKIIKKLTLSRVSDFTQLFLKKSSFQEEVNWRYTNLAESLKSKISASQFKKQQPNMVLTKEDVDLLIKNDYTELYKNIYSPDEHYFINTLVHILNKRVCMKRTHFCNFDIRETQAILFENINKRFIRQLKSLGFLFLRKAGKGSQKAKNQK